jgi:RES domain-containing protein
MPDAWRIVKEKHATVAFSGEGAAKSGGRWNSRGVPVVYTSSTKSLAALAGAFQVCRHSHQI